MSTTFQSLFFEDSKLPDNATIIVEEDTGGEGKVVPPDSSFVLYSLMEQYLKKKYHVVWIMSNNGPTHYFAWMQKMRINYQLYMQKGSFSYIDWFSNPFNDLDFESLPLSEAFPPTFKHLSTLKNLHTWTFDPDSPARENLTNLLSKITSTCNSSWKTPDCKGILVLFDTLNPLLASLDADALCLLEFTNSLSSLLSSLALTPCSSSAALSQADCDDYYDDDEDDAVAMRLRRGKGGVGAAVKMDEGGMKAVGVVSVDKGLMDGEMSKVYGLVREEWDGRVQVRGNDSGYSLDVDGKVEVWMRNDGQWQMNKAKNFKVRENAVEYFEFLDV